HDYQVPVVDEGVASSAQAPQPVLTESIPEFQVPVDDLADPVIDLENEEPEIYQLPPLSLLQKTIRLKDPQG
ncbi:MAG TPA: hypothetical protein DEA85_07565, partial [Firmicutes bacterium]|nr:hypothetical protein [Bacillota bacterium]